MKKTQTNTQYGWKAVRDVLLDHQKTWSRLPAFAKGVDAFINNCKMVGELAKAQRRTSKAVTRTKNAVRTLAIGLGYQAAMNLKSWAKDAGADAVFVAMAFSRARLDAEGDSSLAEVLQEIAALSRDHLADLKDYGTDKAFLAGLDAAILKLADLVGRPRSVIAGRKTITARLKEGVNLGKEFLSGLDDLVGNFLSEDPDFVTTYHNVRSGVHFGTRHRAKAAVK